LGSTKWIISGNKKSKLKHLLNAGKIEETRGKIAYGIKMLFKKTNIDEIIFDNVEVGKVVQILHIGSFDTEPYSFEKLESFMEKQGLLRKFDYHTEIYLSNKNRTSEENLKTILRYSVK